jgi:hypothetical protein
VAFEGLSEAPPTGVLRDRDSESPPFYVSEESSKSASMALASSWAACSTPFFWRINRQNRPVRDCDGRFLGGSEYSSLGPPRDPRGVQARFNQRSRLTSAVTSAAAAAARVPQTTQNVSTVEVGSTRKYSNRYATQASPVPTRTLPPCCATAGGVAF